VCIVYLTQMCRMQRENTKLFLNQHWLRVKKQWRLSHNITSENNQSYNATAKKTKMSCEQTVCANNALIYALNNIKFAQHNILCKRDRISKHQTDASLRVTNFQSTLDSLTFPVGQEKESLICCLTLRSTVVASRKSRTGQVAFRIHHLMNCGCNSCRMTQGQRKQNLFKENVKWRPFGANLTVMGGKFVHLSIICHTPLAPSVLHDRRPQLQGLSPWAIGTSATAS